MSALFANNAYGFLASEISVGATTITLGAGEGARFPQPDITLGTTFLATMAVLTLGKETAWEIVSCTARVGDVLTVTRQRETSGSFVWPAGTRIEHRITANIAERMLRGDLIFDNVIKTASFSPATGRFYFVNAAAAINVTLPSAVVNGDVIGFRNLATNTATFPWTFLRSGKLIYNLAEDMTMDYPSFSGILQYSNSGWAFL